MTHRQTAHEDLKRAFRVKDRKLLIFYFGGYEDENLSLSIFKRGLILLGVSKDVDVEDLYETYRSGKDIFTFHDLERCVGRIRSTPSKSSTTMSPESIPLPSSSSKSFLSPGNKGESLRDALARKIQEKGDSVMFFMSGQNGNAITLRSFRRGLRLLNLNSYTDEEVDMLFRKIGGSTWGVMMDALNNSSSDIIHHNEKEEQKEKKQHQEIVVTQNDNNKNQQELSSDLMQRLSDAYTKISITFAQLDTDQDGYISETEFELGLRRHLHLSDQDIVTIFNNVDNDGDGTVSYAEFTKFMRSIDAFVDEKMNKPHFMNADQNWKRHQKALGFQEYHKRFHAGKWTAGGDMEELRPETHSPTHQGTLHNETNLHVIEETQGLSNESRLFEGSLRDTRVTSREHRAFGAHGETANFRRHGKLSAKKLKEIRNKLKSASYVGTKGHDYRVLFTRMDKDHSGRLSKAEFLHGLKKRVSLSDQEEELLWNRVDVDRSGEVEIEEFIRFMNGKKKKSDGSDYKGHDPFYRHRTSPRKKEKKKQQASPPPSSSSSSRRPSLNESVSSSKNNTPDNFKMHVSPDGAIDIDIIKYGDYNEDEDEDPPPPSEPTPPPPSRKSPRSSSSPRRRKSRRKHDRAVFGSSVSTQRNNTIDISTVPKRGPRAAKPKRGSIWSSESKKNKTSEKKSKKNKSNFNRRGSLQARLASVADDLTLAFTEVDRDGDGFITFDELQDAIQSRVNLSHGDISELYAMADADGDGNVSHAEFTKMMRRIDEVVDEKTSSPHFMNKDQNWKRHQKALGFQEYHKRFHAGKWTAGGDMEELRPESHAPTHRGSLHNETSLHLMEETQGLSNESRLFEGSLRDTRVTDREHRAFSAHAETADFRENAKLSDRKLKILKNKLRAASYIGTKGRDLRVMFSRLDKDHSGQLSKPEFLSGVKKLARLSDQESELLWSHVDEDNSGEVDLDEFMEFVTGKKNVYSDYAGKDPFHRSNSSSTSSKKKIRSFPPSTPPRHNAEHSGGNVKKSPHPRLKFVAAAKKSAMRRSSSSSPSSSSSSTTTTKKKKNDSDILARAHQNAAQKQRAPSLSRRDSLRDRLFRVASDLTLAFTEVDKDGDGFITFDELHDAIRAKVDLSPKDVGELYAMADTDGDGNVSHAEFSKFMRRIDSVVDEKTNSPHFMNADQNWKRHQKALGFQEYHKRFHAGKWTAGGDMEELRPETHSPTHRGSLHNETNLHVIEETQGLSNESRLFEGSLRDTRVTSREHRAFGAHGETANFRRHGKLSAKKLKLIRNKIRAATYVGTKGRDLRVLFHRLDRDHSGRLSKAEFTHGLKKLVNLSDQEQDLLWQRVDVDRSGEVEIEEFAAFVQNNKNLKVMETYHAYDGHDPFDRRQVYRNKGVSPDARTKASVRKLRLRLRDELKVDMETMCKAFVKADTQCIGKLTYSKFKEFLSNQCPELSEREVHVFLTQVDPKGMGSVVCESLTSFLKSLGDAHLMNQTQRSSSPRKSRSPRRRRVAQHQNDVSSSKLDSPLHDDYVRPAHAPLHVEYGEGRVHNAHDWIALGGELAPHEKKETPGFIRRAWGQGKSPSWPVPPALRSHLIRKMKRAAIPPKGELN